MRIWASVLRGCKISAGYKFELVAVYFVDSGKING
jgi:hypothetical protein